MTTNYVRLFWKYILLLVLTTVDVTTQAPEGLTFTCDGTGKITDIKQNGTIPEKIAIEMFNGTYCHYSEQKCKDAVKKAKLHVIIQSDTQAHLLAGQPENIKHYNIECKDDYDVTATAAPFKVSPSSTPQPTSVAKTKTPPILSLKIFKTGVVGELKGDVLIGEKLTLQMSSPAYHVIPKKCTAINGEHADDMVDIWTYKKDNTDGHCSTFDSAITNEKWNISNTKKTTSILMYAFQFTSSPNVIISCSAHLCPSTNATCSESCMDSVTRRRRRRDSQILKKEQPVTRTEEAQVSFRVVTENIVHNQANALYVSFTVLITAIIFGERLARFV